MKKLILVVICLVVPLMVLAQSDEPSTGEGERACLENFTEEGSFFKGKTYKTWQTYEGLEFERIFRRIAQKVAEDNWGDVKADKDLGIITAEQTVTMGKGTVAPLNVIVKEVAGGLIRVEANFGTAGGQRASRKTVRDGLCELVEAAGELAPASP